MSESSSVQTKDPVPPIDCLKSISECESQSQGVDGKAAQRDSKAELK